MTAAQTSSFRCVPGWAVMRALLLALALGACAHVDEQFERPAVIRFGASVAALERALEGQCTRRRLRTDDPVFLPNVRERQLQIDCEGFQFFSQGPRRVRHPRRSANAGVAA